MSKRYPGNFITGNPVAVSQTSNNGIWDLKDQYQATGNNTWQESDGIYEIGRSLRFRRSNSAYLSRTAVTPTDGKRATFSFWVKKADVGVGTVESYRSIYYSGTPNSDGLRIGWARYEGYENNGIMITQDNGSSASHFNLFSTDVFRDPAAWYHFVIRYDSTDTVANNRVKIFVNGREITSFTARTNPSLNHIPTWQTNGYTQKIGKGRDDVNEHADMYLTEVNFIDGLALDPSYFGYNDSITGIWYPKKYTGAYGNNGYYILGNTTPETNFANYIGGGSSGNYLTAPYSTDFALTNQDFTLEAFVYAAEAFSQNDHGIFNFGENVTSVNGKSLIFTGVASGSTSPNRSLRMALSSNGSSNDLVNYVEVGNIELYTWNHVALTRTGGYIYVNINGRRTYSYNIGSTSLYNQTTYGPSIAAYRNSGSFASTSSWPGAISNVRFTIGQCLYTGTTFTAPTAPLTTTSQGATSSNVKLLCCQSSTAAVDNSQYGRTLTNVGTASFVDYAMSLTDRSGNLNTWSFNNQLVLNLPGNRSTANWDIMVDSPTNVFTTATDIGGVVPGNYCTWNFVSKSSTVTLSEANLKTIANTADWCAQYATMGAQNGGKWYWEYVCYPNNNSSQGFCKMIGMVPPTAVPTNTYIGNAGYGYGLWVPDGSGGTAFQKRYNGSGTTMTGHTSGYALINGDVIQVAYDALNGQIWFGKNNTWFEGNPSAGTGASYTGIDTSVQWLPAINEWYNTTGGMTNNFTQTNFGQRPFAYTPPAGFKSLNTTNLQAIGTSAVGNAAIQANKWFDTTLYGGTGAPRNVENSGFQPDMIWIKSRNAGQWHNITDSVRGAGAEIFTNATNAEETNGGISSINSNGFSLINWDGANNETDSYVAWQWKQSPTAGLNIVSWTGDGTNNRAISHNLGVVPAMIIVKDRTVGYNWDIYHQSLGISATMIFSNSIGTRNASAFGSTAPTSSNFYTQNSYTNTSGSRLIAYVFAEVPGFSKFGSFSGNGASDGPFIYTGFRPRFFMYKAHSHSSDWWLLDATRSSINVAGNYVFPNAASSEGVESTWIDFLSNGIKIRGRTDSNTNGSDRSYVYMAFAESPFGLNNRAR